MNRSSVLGGIAGILISIPCFAGTFTGNPGIPSANQEQRVIYVQDQQEAKLLYRWLQVSVREYEAEGWKVQEKQGEHLLCRRCTSLDGEELRYMCRIIVNANGTAQPPY